jgi:hypothetical protein
MEVLDMKALGKALAFVALLVLVGAGTATAANMITGKQIENGTVTGADIKKKTLSSKHLTAGAKDTLKGAAGPAGPQGAAGPAGPAGPQGPAGHDGQDGGPHRYAELNAAGVLQEDVKNIDQTQVSHPEAGRYCFTFPSGDRPTSGAANGLSSDTIATLDLDPAGAIPGCPAGSNVQVRTYDPSVGNYQDNAFRLILSSN